MIPDTVFRLRLNPESNVIPAFLPLALGSEAVQSDWFGRKIGLADAQVNINHSILKSTNFPQPRKIEQEEIVERFSVMMKRREREQLHLAKLHYLKAGLMQDLLTGNVRVKLNGEVEGV